MFSCKGIIPIYITTSYSIKTVTVVLFHSLLFNFYLELAIYNISPPCCRFHYLSANTDGILNNIASLIKPSHISCQLNY